MMHTMLTIAEWLGGAVGYMGIGVVTSAVISAKVDRGDEIAPVAGVFWPIVPVILVLMGVCTLMLLPLEKVHDRLVSRIKHGKPPKLPKARKIERLRVGG